MKSLTLASKPQVLKNCPVLGSRTALFFEPLKFCRKAPETSQKICEDLFLFSSSGNRLKKIFEELFCLKKIFEDLFFWRTLAPVFLVFGLGLKRVCPWPWSRNFFVPLSLASSLCPRLHLCPLLNKCFKRCFKLGLVYSNVLNISNDMYHTIFFVFVQLVS